MGKLLLGTILAVFLAITSTSKANDSQSKGQAGDLKIAYDVNTDRVIVTWSGKGVLKKASELNGKFKPVRVEETAISILGSAATKNQFIASTALPGMERFTRATLLATSTCSFLQD